MKRKQKILAPKSRSSHTLSVSHLWKSSLLGKAQDTAWPHPLGPGNFWSRFSISFLYFFNHLVQEGLFTCLLFWDKVSCLHFVWNNGFSALTVENKRRMEWEESLCSEGLLIYSFFRWRKYVWDSVLRGFHILQTPVANYVGNKKYSRSRPK